MRLLLIRHAQSEQNAYMETLLTELQNKTLSVSSFNRKMRQGPPGTDAGADAVLTSLGKSQAQRLGLTYAPLLLSKAKQGKLIVCVSPFQRCLMTANPLMKEIRKEMPSFQATILPAIMESGGLTDQADFQHFDQIDAFNKQGKRDEAIQVLKSIQWKRQGMSGNMMKRKFPWVNLNLNSSASLFLTKEITQSPWGEVQDNDQPWWTYGFESKKRTHRRITAVGNWLTKHVSTHVPDDVVLVFICHGGTIQELINQLVNNQSSVDYGPIRNTSVTSLILPSPHFQYNGDRPKNNTAGGSNKIDRYQIRIEVLNGTEHLGKEQLTFWSKSKL